MGEPRPVGSVRSKTARACARANFSHTYFYTNFAAKITANRLVSSYMSVRFLDINFQKLNNRFFFKAANDVDAWHQIKSKRPVQ